ncbi:MAG TPA: CBS domain-containing protein [Nitrososphaera sp.]|nr:CBS domain-containing protein [Nitrososphaera sp.]
MARNNNEGATVADYMTTRMITMDGKESVLDIAKRMAERNISSVAITDEKDMIIGILTERDVVKIVAKAVPPNGITAGSLMSNPVVSIGKGSSVEDAARVMAQKKVRHLLVEDPSSRQIMGMVTVTDLARYLRQNLADEEITASEVWELFF